MKPFAAMFSYPTVALRPLAQRQSFFPIDPFHHVFTGLPALPAEHCHDRVRYGNRKILGDLPDPHPQFGLRTLVAVVPIGPAAHPAHPAGPPLADSVLLTPVLDDRTLLRGL